MPRYSDEPERPPERPGPPEAPPRRQTVMEKAIIASQKGSAASYEQPPAGIPIFGVAAVALIIVLVFVGIFASGGSTPNETAQGPDVAQVQQVEMPTAAPAATEAPAPTAAPTPEGIAFANVGTDSAAENKVNLVCGEQQLVFSIMLRKRAADGRLEVTLQTNVGTNAIDAIYGNSNGTILVPGTTCGLNIKWTGTEASYTEVGP